MPSRLTKCFLSPLHRFFLVTALALSGGLAHAVLPPQYEARNALGRIVAADEQRQAAPVVVKLKILKIQVSSQEGNHCPSHEGWKVKARVVAVTRGALKANQIISLTYQRELYACPGPIREALPEIKKGDEIKAYLHCDGKRCQPVASAMSFMADDVFGQETARRKENAARYESVPE